jgi:hypothetical protein
VLREQILRALPFARRLAVQAKTASGATVRLGEILAAQQRVLLLAEGMFTPSTACVVQREEPAHV